jgi:hypothetical protein
VHTQQEQGPCDNPSICGAAFRGTAHALTRRQHPRDRRRRLRRRPRQAGAAHGPPLRVQGAGSGCELRHAARLCLCHDHPGCTGHPFCNSRQRCCAGAAPGTAIVDGRVHADSAPRGLWHQRCIGTGRYSGGACPRTAAAGGARGACCWRCACSRFGGARPGGPFILGDDPWGPQQRRWRRRTSWDVFLQYCCQPCSRRRGGVALAVPFYSG